MKALISQIRGSLADAFGGFSQYSLESLGAAIAGQINNNGLQGSIPALCAEAAHQECARFAGMDWNESEVSVSVEVALRAALERLSGWPDRLQNPPRTPRLPRNERGVRGRRFPARTV